MKHFLITRFNIKSDNWTHTRKGDAILTDSWLQQRLQIFETYCLPSVINQTNPNFKWCLCFDPNTPKEFLDSIAQFSKTCPQIHLVFSDGFRNLQNDLVTSINKLTDDSDRFIITTRLDNDDIIHKAFVENIQALATQNKPTVIDLTHGYQLTLTETDNDLRYFKKQFNPFISIVEPVEDFETVIAKKHSFWKAFPHVISSKQPLWIQLVHDTNLVNRKRKALKKVLHFNSADFALDSIETNQDKANARLHNFLLPFYRMYLFTGKIFKKIR